jgi:hypothetical protein
VKERRAAEFFDFFEVMGNCREILHIHMVQPAVSLTRRRGAGSGGGAHLPPGPAETGIQGVRTGAGEVIPWTLFQFVMAMMAFGTFLLTLLRFIFDHHDKHQK